ncbi:alpha/beta fold hydrolase, partial [Kibdelosporangium lantanae]
MADPSFDVAVARRKATGVRTGVLLVDPGGPGDSGVDFALRKGYFSPRIEASFDIVGFDPRGVSRSNAVTCSPEVLARKPSAYPRDQAEFDTLAAYNRELRADCGERTGPLYDHLDTLSTVMDMDAIRRALGEPRISYFGHSYGSLFGEQYAELFGDRVRAMVVTGTVDHGRSGTQFLTDVAAEAAEISRKMGKPVKLSWSRTDDFRQGRTHPMCVSRIRATHLLGQVLTFEQRHASSETSFSHGLGEMITATAARLPIAGNLSFAESIFLLTQSVPYNFGVVTQLLNEIPLKFNTGSMRNIYSPNVVTALELVVDQLAKKMGKDPIAFRREFLRDERLRAVLDKVDRGLLRLDQQIQVPADIVIPDGDGIIKLDRAYPSAFTLGHVLALLLTISDDTCVRLCGSVCPSAELNQILRDKGFPKTQVDPVANPNRFFLGKTTPKEMHDIFQGLVQGRLLSATSTDFLFNILRSQVAFTDGIRRVMSSFDRARVATKAGWLHDGRNEAGIMFDKNGKPVLTYSLFADGQG